MLVVTWAVPGMALHWQICLVASQEAFDVVALMWALYVANGVLTVVGPMVSHYDETQV